MRNWVTAIEFQEQCLKSNLHFMGIYIMSKERAS
jgi:hypothetical protein